MATTVTVRDETTTGELTYELALTLTAERLTGRDLLKFRVQEEVADYNEKQPEYFRGLVQPSDAERTLNGYKLSKARELDWQEQFEKAVEAFERSGFVMLVNDRQVESLDEEIELTTDTTVTFLKLVPLVGG